MAKSRLHELSERGQSVWIDSLSREMLETGTLAKLMEEDAVVGVTSNPSIFQKALEGEGWYDEQLKELASEPDLNEVFIRLASHDIERACDLMRPVFERSDGTDGFVSMEVDPNFAHDTERTLQQALRFHDSIDRPNLYVKIPATKAGLPAIEECIAQGRSINITLIFSLERYAEVLEAYLRGVERLRDSGGDISKVRSVASFFVSRVDTEADKRLEAIGTEEALAVRGQLAIANAKLAYEHYRQHLLERALAGARRGRSASAALPVGVHLDEEPGLSRRPLRRGADRAGVGEHDAVRDDRGVPGSRRDTRRHDPRGPRRGARRVRPPRVARRRLRRRRPGARGRGRPEVLGGVCPPDRRDPHAPRPDGDRLSELVTRIWERDPTVWTGQDEAKWLGWLDEPRRMREQAAEIMRVAAEARAELGAVVLLGMGGSSLAPEVLVQSFGVEGFHVLDTTHPEAIRRLEAQLDLAGTLFVSASKSGSTIETRSHTDYFWEKAPRGSQWIAITDPGSQLEALARAREFRAVFAGEPTIGGRYSALSPFGMVPAALMGIDLVRLLEGAIEMAGACRGAEGNRGLDLGLGWAEGWSEGRDKICIEGGGSFGLWAEQLIAESTGKQGKGLIPAPGEPGEGDDRQTSEVELSDPYDLGKEFFRWEFATAVVGHALGINPFDQPNVQEAKDRTKELLDSGDDPQLELESSPEELFGQAQAGDYVCIQAFVPPSDENDSAIAELVAQARAATGCVVTHGYGPRYLHSTGQLHKGGPPKGLFLQVVDSTGEELAIPGQPFGFGRLIRAQAAGDYAALKERGLPVARIRL